MAGTERAGGPTSRLMHGFPAWDTKFRGVKTSSTSEIFFPLHSSPGSTFWPCCRALCRAPADGHCSASVCARFIHMSGAAFLLQSCTVALGGIPNVTPELLLRADKSTGSSSAASRVPRGSRRDQHRDGGCWLGTVQIWGSPKAQFQGKTPPGGDSVRNSFPRRRSGEQRAFQMWRQEAEQGEQEMHQSPFLPTWRGRLCKRNLGQIWPFPALFI